MKFLVRNYHEERYFHVKRQSRKTLLFGSAANQTGSEMIFNKPTSPLKYQILVILGVVSVRGHTGKPHQWVKTAKGKFNSLPVS